MTIPISFGSVCAGVGGIDLGLENAGFVCKWQIEIDAACRNVLRKRFPESKLYEDATKFRDYYLDPIRILAGGTPCQGFSIAGYRKGIEDDRSNLCLTFCEIADQVNADVIVWENVPGVLSLEDNAFGCFLAALVGLDTALVHPDTDNFRPYWRKGKNGRYPIWPRAGMVTGPKRTAAWRVLNSEYFGVPQRRERVFVVADTRGGRSSKILFESEVLRRNSAPSREEGEKIANALGAGTKRSGGCTDVERMTFIPEIAKALKASDGGIDREDGHTLLATHDVSPCLQERGYKGADSDCTQAYAISKPIGFDRAYGIASGDVAGPLRVMGAVSEGVRDGKPDNQCVAFRSTGQDGFTPSVTSPPLVATDGGGTVPTVFMLHSQNSKAMTKQGDGVAGAPASVVRSLDTNGGFTAGQGGNVVVGSGYRVRRLTPTECERLQGWPVGWTHVGETAEGLEIFQKDSPRYRQCGNGVTSNVAEWIGRRIKRFGFEQ